MIGKIDTPLEYVYVEDIEENDTVLAKARYLYWACFRGYNNLVKYIIEKDRVSPFARIFNHHSPMMASLTGKSVPFSGQNLDSSLNLLIKNITNCAQLEICSR